MSTTCPACGARSAEGGARCPSCGAPVRGFAEERRHLTVLFADLCGSTAFAQDRDPEDVHLVIADCIASMSGIVSRHGGTVIRVVGDEVMALFGAPLAHGDDPERAVRAALDLAAASPGGLDVRVGVNSGEVFLAPMGQGDARAFTVSGAAVNLAARLRSQAPRRGVLVGEDTRRATRFSVEYDEVPPLSVAGFSAQVAAWAPTRVLEGRIGPLADATFVGREAELAQLLDRRRAALAGGRPAVVTLLGPAGIGKSRLVAELRARVDADGGTVVSGRCVAHGRTTPYDAVAGVVRGLAGGDLAGWLRGLDESDRRHLRLLAGVPEPGDHAAGLSALVSTLVTGLERAGGPDLVLLEDLHWSLDTQLTLLRHALPRLRRPLLVVATGRPELEDRWPATDRIALGPLPAAAAADLVRAVVGPGPDREAVSRVVGLGGGSPLLLEELGADLREGGTVGDRRPGSLLEVVGTRLDSLPGSARSTLMTAAVLRPDATAAELALACGRDVEADLALLRRRDLLRPGGTTVAFRHDALAEVAYGMLPRRRREELHTRFATLLEERREAAPRDLLAHHWHRGGHPGRAAEHLLAAADTAREAWAKADAVRWYQEALDLLDGADPRRPAVALRVGLTMVEEGRFGPAVEALEEVLPRLAGDQLAEAYVGLSTGRFWLMQTDRAREAAERALEVTAPGSPTAARARAARSLALSTSETRTSQGIEEGEALLAHWPREGSPRDRLELVSSLGTYHYWTGDHARSRRRSEEALRLARASHDVDQALLAASALGMALVGEGRPQEALAVYEDAVALGLAHELVPRFTSRVVSMQGGALRELGDLDAARAASARAVDLARQAEFPFPVLQSRIDLLCCDLLEGGHEEADRAWPGLQEHARSLPGWHTWLTLGRLAVARAEIDHGLGRYAEAVAAAEDAESYARRTQRPKYAVAASRLRGRSLLALGEAAAAGRVFRAAAQQASTLGHPPTTWSTLAALAAAETALGEADAALRHQQHARTVRDAFAARLEPARRRTFLDSPAAALA